MSNHQSNASLLTSEQWEKVIQDVVRSFDVEVTRLLVKEKQLRIIETFLKLYHDKDLFTFFTLVNLKDFSEYIFSDDLLRSFTLNLTERVMMNWGVVQSQYNHEFIETLTKSIATTKVAYSANSSNLINREVQETIQLTPEVLSTLLKDNPWLSIIYILLVNFNRSVIYQGLQEKA